ncbi:MAG: M23 family metallopeptidase [Deltaproteobacteria bacterium]|nr:M23 family metallopeptidase [Deltaproteobacteria bacterium]
MSSSQLYVVCGVLMVMVLWGAYFVHKYVHLKNVNTELAGALEQTKEQTRELEKLVMRFNEFAVRVEELREFGIKIKDVALSLDGKRKKTQMLGMGGPISDDNFLQTRLDGDRRLFIHNMNKNMEKLMSDAASQEESFKNLLDYFKEQKSILAAKPSLWPVKGWISSGFGYRKSPFTGRREFHRGIDIATRAGKEIHAPSDGIVAEVSRRADEGLMIRINHGYGIVTAYAHLLKTKVKEGDVLQRGDVIGTVGNSGRSTGPHLHYGIFVNDVPVNPRKYLQ